jgi:hypothetical protein
MSSITSRFREVAWVLRLAEVAAGMVAPPLPHAVCGHALNGLAGAAPVADFTEPRSLNLRGLRGQGTQLPSAGAVPPLTRCPGRRVQGSLVRRRN